MHVGHAALTWPNPFVAAGLRAMVGFSRRRVVMLCGEVLLIVAFVMSFPTRDGWVGACGFAFVLGWVFGLAGGAFSCALRGAATLAGERERQTLDLLRVTPLKAVEVSAGLVVGIFLAVLADQWALWLPASVVWAFVGRYGLAEAAAIASIILCCQLLCAALGVAFSAWSPRVVPATVAAVLLALFYLIAPAWLFRGNALTGTRPSGSSAESIIGRGISPIGTSLSWMPSGDGREYAGRPPNPEAVTELLIYIPTTLALTAVLVPVASLGFSQLDRLWPRA
jgi:hypothetical protein